MTDTIKHDNLSDALYAIREEVGPLTRDATADTGKFTYRYLTLPTLLEKVDPIAWKHGVLIQHMLNGDKLRRVVWFNNEPLEPYDVVLPNPQETAQGLGSAITYLRRYDTLTFLGLIADDDDGVAASAPKPVAVVRKAPTRAEGTGGGPTEQSPPPVSPQAIAEAFPGAVMEDF